jgi:hypothetical protein
VEAVGDWQPVARGRGGGGGLSGGMACGTGEGERLTSGPYGTVSAWSIEFESDSKFKRFK